jgi:hypothetical protein
MSTLTISFTTSVIPPAFGYKIKYWDVTTPAAINTTTVTTSPATVTGLTGTSYAGTVEAMCNATGGSTPQSFTATAAGSTESELLFTNFQCGSAYFFLTTALTGPFTINAFSINGFDNNTCSIGSGGPVTTILATPQTIATGQTLFSIPLANFAAQYLSYRPLPSIKINGIVVPDGGTFVVNGTIVTVNIPATCAAYTNCPN